MDKLSSLAKNGWHPEKTGSVKGDLKSWIGKGSGEGSMSAARERAESHNSTPLSSLKDASTFAPPPRRVGTGLSASESGDVSSPAAVSPSSSSWSTSRPVPSVPDVPTRTSYSKPVGEKEEAPAVPAGPFRADTTGLSTANLPPPPVRRVGSPATTSPARTAKSNVVLAIGKKPGPPLPPRLPPRSAVAGAGVPSDPPPSYGQATNASTPARNSVESTGLVNIVALNRLGAAGVSVPGLNIGKPTLQTTNVSSEGPESTKANVSELQSRFAALNSAVSARVADGDTAAAAAARSAVDKKPVLPPKKNFNLTALGQSSTASDDERTDPPPPPVPFGTKPR